MIGTRPGRPHPLGATFDGSGVNFALFSENATAVELCLFDETDRETRIPLRERTAHVWHGYVPGLAVGQRYGYRVDGPYEPARGMRFNANKLLVDPYARAIAGKVDYRQPVFGYGRTDAERDLRDSARGAPRGVVVADAFDWGNDRAPDVPWPDTVLYELHVRGFTMRHPGVPEAVRGTYLGLASPAAIEHLVSLGVTAVELLPVHECVDEPPLFARGMTNYWGYNTLGFFAPDQRFASRPGRQVTEFKEMVKALHAGGIEVILDVVYNHSCEGDRKGPTLSLRGVDNTTYYRLQAGTPAEYEDFSGCGNSLNMLHPQALKLVMDSLRYWVTEMRVDGFRFDLASTLARETRDVDKLSGFFDIIHQDPILSRVKLIAEPWDLGEGGYQVGNFPVLWTEWNGRYRDTVRRFWRGEAAVLPDLGYRLTGSSDLYEDDGRRPHASINFITAHDGFTLRDLVSYQRKHNEANGEENRDGWDDNLNWNCGVEGETSDAAIVALRARQQKNLLATLILSQGVPMLTSGDELGKTQRGNNNAYVQDNDVSWLDWELDEPRRGLLAFTRSLLALRRTQPVFRRRHFLRGQPVGGSGLKDVAWFRPDGKEMSDGDWQRPRGPAIALLLAGDALAWRDVVGEPVVGDTFLLLLNAGAKEMPFALPDVAWGERWEMVLDTGEGARGEMPASAPGDVVRLTPRSFAVFRRVAPERGSWRPFRAAP